MQMPMTLDACDRCGQPIRPGEPVRQTAAVDIVGGRAVASAVTTAHLEGRCADDARAADAARRQAPKAA
ncbi:MAG: hypothetical protein OXG69_05045 [bacterium]|nr:hypothetical protein [bacterium]